MSEFSGYFDRLAAHTIDERVNRARAAGALLPTPRRPRGRHAWAQRLHRLAERLDG